MRFPRWSSMAHLNLPADVSTCLALRPAGKQEADARAYRE
jgi:hypothetical protein